MLDNLPCELLMHCLIKCHVDDILNMSLTNKKYSYLMMDSNFWLNKVRQDLNINLTMIDFIYCLDKIGKNIMPETYLILDGLFNNDYELNLWQLIKTSSKEFQHILYYSTEILLKYYDAKNKRHIIVNHDKDIQWSLINHYDNMIKLLVNYCEKNKINVDYTLYLTISMLRNLDNVVKLLIDLMISHGRKLEVNDYNSLKEIAASDDKYKEILGHINYYNENVNA